MNIESSPRRLRRTLRRRAGGIGAFAVVSVLTAMAVSSCAESEESTVVLGGAPDGSPGPIFHTVPEAAPDVSLTQYCASSDCPDGYTTCPTSTFRCDVDLLSDNSNCGECGVACPEGTTCNNGRCALVCPAGSGLADCNTIVDDGCETDLSKSKSCGACGVVCPSTDPRKVCADQDGFGNFKCGCSGTSIPCPAPGFPAPICVDVKPDDANCGACGNTCDPTKNQLGAIGVLYPNTHYGCADGKCGALKCDGNFGDCDGDIQNGCETYLYSDSACGACGASCPAGESCAKLALGFFGTVPGCACPVGQSFCSAGDIVVTLPDGGVFTDTPPTGKCLDLTSDPDNCGACGLACPGLNRSNSTRSCDYGKCSITCIQGSANCNGDTIDGCETNIDADPSNCGGCGIVCDAIAGQACAGGHCVVKPCGEPEDGGPVR